MLIPKRVAHRKQHHPKRAGKSKGATKIEFGDFGLQALTSSYVTNRQIEAARRALSRHVKRGGKIWIRVFPDKPITKKPLEVRQGKGKGSVEYWVSLVQPGRILFEIEGISEELAREAMRLAAHKLPIKTKFVTREQTQADQVEGGEVNEG